MTNLEKIKTAPIESIARSLLELTGGVDDAVGVCGEHCTFHKICSMRDDDSCELTPVGVWVQWLNLEWKETRHE